MDRKKTGYGQPSLRVSLPAVVSMNIRLHNASSMKKVFAQTALKNIVWYAKDGAVQRKKLTLKSFIDFMKNQQRRLCDKNV